MVVNTWLSHDGVRSITVEALLKEGWDSDVYNLHGRTPWSHPRSSDGRIDFVIHPEEC